MRLVIEDKDFRRLSAGTRKELMGVLAGRRGADLRAVDGGGRKAAFRADRPIDLTPELAGKLLHGLAPNHRRRLELFASNGGRVSMKELLAVTHDKDLRVLSYFQGAVTRKLRRLLDDKEKRIFLVGWDYETTRWDKDHKTIVDGVNYVSEKTTHSLKDYFSTA